MVPEFRDIFTLEQARCTGKKRFKFAGGFEREKTLFTFPVNALTTLMGNYAREFFMLEEVFSMNAMKAKEKDDEKKRWKIEKFM